MFLNIGGKCSNSKKEKKQKKMVVEECNQNKLNEKTV